MQVPRSNCLRRRRRFSVQVRSNRAALVGESKKSRGEDEDWWCGVWAVAGYYFVNNV